MVEALQTVYSLLVYYPPSNLCNNNGETLAIEHPWITKWTQHAETFRSLCRLTDRLLQSFFDIDQASYRVVSSYVESTGIGL
jgi:hypothetical protein